MCCRSVVVALCLAASAPVAWAGQETRTPSGALTLLAPEGRQPIPTTTVGGREMVSLGDLVSLFGLSIREDALAGGLTVAYKGKTIVLTPDQSVASVAGRLVSLPAPVVRDGRRWLVPVEFIDRALAPVYDTPLELRRQARLVLLGDVRVPRVVARQEMLGSQVRVTLDVTPATAETIAQEPRRLLVRFEADALDAALPATGIPGLVESIQLVEPGAAVAINLGAKFGSFRTATVPGDAGQRRIVIDILAAAPAPPPATPATPASAPATPPLPLPGLIPGPALRTVVIDPGHGGEETGARGPAGTLEKDITLAVAGRLKTLLESRLGIRVLLTREADVTVALDERAALANNNKADLFVSLHANASVRGATAGAQVYYLSTDGLAEQARDAASAGDLVPVLGGGSRTVDVILWEMAQTRHLAESAELATFVQDALAEQVPVNRHPVQQAPFRVLLGANMPAVLIEMGFLTNAAEEARLKTGEYQAQIAQALYAAIVRFRDRIEQTRAVRPPSSAPGGPIEREP